MKKIICKLSIALTCVIVLSSVYGCSKDDEEFSAYYKYFGLEDMYYIQAEEGIAVAFFNELGTIMEKNDGHYFTDSSLKSQIEKVVRKYNNGVVSGTFYLKKTTESKDYGPWTTVASWTMNFASRYTRAESISSNIPLVLNKE